MSILPDVLELNLNVVFCGTAAGSQSAERQAYYANPTNSFWKTLHQVGLTPVQLAPDQYPQILDFDLGLTDISKVGVGMDGDLAKIQYGVEGIRTKIKAFQPGIVCFNGKMAAKAFIGTENVPYGLHKQTIGKTLLFVAPSTSGGARRYWDIKHWIILSKIEKEIR